MITEDLAAGIMGMTGEYTTSLRKATAAIDAAIAAAVQAEHSKRDDVIKSMMIALDRRDTRDDDAYNRVYEKFGSGVAGAWVEIVEMYKSEATK